MKIAIMQPYFFPYAGYFELISEVDIFVYFTDVQYIERGWVNRNRIKCRDNWMYITVPIVKHHQSEKIDNIKIANKEWAKNHIKSFQHEYGCKVDEEFVEVYNNLSRFDYLSTMLLDSLEWTCSKLKIATKRICSSGMADTFKSQERIIQICKHLNADTYINLPGGRQLYDQNTFKKEGIELKFMPMTARGTLSIIDNLFNDKNNLCF